MVVLLLKYIAVTGTLLDDYLKEAICQGTGIHIYYTEAQVRIMCYNVEIVTLLL